jgi:hypothetical protein
MTEKDQKYTLFNRLFSIYSYNETIKESRRERLKKSLTENCYVYGEIDYVSMKEVLDKIEDLKEKSTFVDLGSGIGKAVFSAGLLGNFKRCTGVELLRNLHLMAESIKEESEEIERKEGLRLINSELIFINKDLLEYDFSNDDVVFTNSTCWNKRTLELISIKSNDMKLSSYLINTDQELNLSQSWKRVLTLNTQMSWGIARTFINKRIRI